MPRQPPGLRVRAGMTGGRSEVDIGTDHLPEGLTRQSIRAQRRTLLITGAAAVLITMLAPLAVVVSNGRVGTMDLLSDPAELTGAPWYLGL